MKIYKINGGYFLKYKPSEHKQFMTDMTADKAKGKIVIRNIPDGYGFNYYPNFIKKYKKHGKEKSY